MRACSMTSPSSSTWTTLGVVAPVAAARRR
ncbi:MYXO-CTERM sorting domain-containing protein [Phycicoccus sp.]